MALSFPDKISNLFNGMMPIYVAATRQMKSCGDKNYDYKDEVDRLVALNSRLFDDANNLLENHWSEHHFDSSDYIGLSAAVASFIQAELPASKKDESALTERFNHWADKALELSQQIARYTDETAGKGTVPAKILVSVIGLCSSIEKALAQAPLCAHSDSLAAEIAISIIQSANCYASEAADLFAENFSEDDFYSVTASIIDVTAIHFSSYYQIFAHEQIQEECKINSKIIKSWKDLLLAFECSISDKFDLNLFSTVFKKDVENLVSELVSSVSKNIAPSWASVLSAGFFMRVTSVAASAWSEINKTKIADLKANGFSRPNDKRFTWDDEHYQRFSAFLIETIKTTMDSNSMLSFTPNFNALPQYFMSAARNIISVLESVFQRPSNETAPESKKKSPKQLVFDIPNMDPQLFDKNETAEPEKKVKTTATETEINDEDDLSDMYSQMDEDSFS